MLVQGRDRKLWTSSLVLVGTLASFALLLGISLPEVTGAAGPKGKKVMEKNLRGDAGDVLFGYDSQAWWNAGWRNKGRGIKEAWVRFSIGGTAVQCVEDPQSEEAVCQPGLDIIYYSVATCTRPTGFPGTRENVKRAFVVAANQAKSFSLVRSQRVRLSRPRTSCDVQAGIAQPRDIGRETFYRGKIRLRIEVFVKK